MSLKELVLSDYDDNFQKHLSELLQSLGVTAANEVLTIGDLRTMLKRVKLLKDRAHITVEEEPNQQDRAVIFSVKGYISMAVKSELVKHGLRCTMLNDIYDMVTEIASEDEPRWIFIHVDQENSSTFEFAREFLSQVKAAEKDNVTVVFFSSVDSQLKNLDKTHHYVDHHIVIDFGWQDQLSRVYDEVKSENKWNKDEEDSKAAAKKKQKPKDADLSSITNSDANANSVPLQETA
jgi:hypothetical protein